MLKTAPILFILFNRPDLTKQVWDVFKLLKPEKIYISADGPRLHCSTDYENCILSRKITENIDWPCIVYRNYSTKNLGCNLGPRNAISWFFSHEKEGIIIEDDCVPHPDFFEFATLMLGLYRENKNIISINGSNLGYKSKDSSSYSFTRFMSMWGWATWADRALSVDYSLTKWKKIQFPLFFLYSKLRNNYLDFDILWFKYWKNKFDRSLETEAADWWDWQWIFRQLYYNKFSIVPPVNLVTNIGFNSRGTHTKDFSNPASNLKSISLVKPIVHPLQININYDYEEYFVKWVWCFHKRQTLKYNIKVLALGFSPKKSKFLNKIFIR